MILIQGTQVIGDISGHVARLEALIIDLERLTTGQLPSQADLDAAPLLAPYGLSSRPTYCLAGGNHGHPILQGRAIRTSELHSVTSESVVFAPSERRESKIRQPDAARTALSGRTGRKSCFWNFAFRRIPNTAGALHGTRDGRVFALP